MDLARFGVWRLLVLGDFFDLSEDLGCVDPAFSGLGHWSFFFRFRRFSSRIGCVLDCLLFAVRRSVRGKTAFSADRIFRAGFSPDADLPLDTWNDTGS